MRHHNSVRKFGRPAKGRSALLKSLMLALITHEKIETTAARAREMRPMIEKLITKSNEGTLAARRLITARLMNQKDVTKKLMEEIAPRFKGRKGGYTRLTKLPQRLGDASKMAVIEFVS